VRSLLPLLCLSATGLLAADLPRITYSKSFPRSTPAYVEISIDRAGHGQYKEAPDDDSPITFQLTENETAGIFNLADQLGHFTRPLESNLKVAFVGDKTFRWEDPSGKHEVKFNYSVDPAAQQLGDWFERITESELSFVDLQRAAKFDKLGVNQALLLLEVLHDRNRLVARAQYLPLLDHIAKGESYMRMARERAANLAEVFRNPKPAATK
jgi:hypothetical protein